MAVPESNMHRKWVWLAASNENLAQTPYSWSINQGTWSNVDRLGKLPWTLKHPAEGIELVQCDPPLVGTHPPVPPRCATQQHHPWLPRDVAEAFQPLQHREIWATQSRSHQSLMPESGMGDGRVLHRDPSLYFLWKCIKLGKIMCCMHFFARQLIKALLIWFYSCKVIKVAWEFCKFG